MFQEFATAGGRAAFFYGSKKMLVIVQYAVDSSGNDLLGFPAGA